MTTKTDKRWEQKRKFFELKHISRVSVYVLFKDGKPAGKILANFSDNSRGMGDVCKAFVALYGVHDAEGYDFQGVGKAGGYGYDKFSAAVCSALYGCPIKIDVVSGGGNVVPAFKAAGYEIEQIL